MVSTVSRGRPVALERNPGKFQKSFDRWRFQRWFQNKELTTDWTSGYFSSWRSMLGPWRDEPLEILEIGSWEGRSALFFLNFFPNATIVCIDTFLGSDEDQHVNLPGGVQEIEGRFDRNLAAFNARLEKLKCRSAEGLDRLAKEGRGFDLIYVDGGHTHDEVMADSVAAWGLLRPGGVIIWDDYGWGAAFAPASRPKEAVDQFLADRAGGFRLLAKAYQIAVERTGSE